MIPQDVLLEVVLVSRDQGAAATFDGQVGIALQPGDTVEIRASNNKTRLIRFPDRSYYDMLSNKLKLGES